MKGSEVTVEWLQSIDYQIHPTGVRPTIEGVAYRSLKPIVDGRGEVTELWSEPWEGFGPPVHVYQSGTDFGVVKCWHLHDIHTDQFAISRGKVQVTLVDLREHADSFGHVNVFVMGALSPGLLRIPPGIMHGWKALSAPEIIVLNFQSHVYDPADEFKFPWDCVLEDAWQPKNG